MGKQVKLEIFTQRPRSADIIVAAQKLIASDQFGETPSYGGSGGLPGSSVATDCPDCLPSCPDFILGGPQELEETQLTCNSVALVSWSINHHRHKLNGVEDANTYTTTQQTSTGGCGGAGWVTTSLCQFCGSPGEQRTVTEDDGRNYLTYIGPGVTELVRMRGRVSYNGNIPPADTTVDYKIQLWDCQWETGTPDWDPAGATLIGEVTVPAGQSHTDFEFFWTPGNNKYWDPVDETYYKRIQVMYKVDESETTADGYLEFPGAVETTGQRYPTFTADVPNHDGSDLEYLLNVSAIPGGTIPLIEYIVEPGSSYVVSPLTPFGDNYYGPSTATAIDAVWFDDLPAIEGQHYNVVTAGGQLAVAPITSLYTGTKVTGRFLVA